MLTGNSPFVFYSLLCQLPCVIRLCVICIAYILTEEKPRELDGPSTNLALGDIISSALPDINKKEKLNNDVSSFDFLFGRVPELRTFCLVADTNSSQW